MHDNDKDEFQKRIERMLKEKQKRPGGNGRKPGPFMIFVILMLIWLGINLMVQVASNGLPQEITYSELNRLLKETDTIKSVEYREGFLTGQFVDGGRFYLNIPRDDKDLLALLKEKNIEIVVKPEQTFLASVFYYFGPVLLLVFFYWFFAFRGNNMGNRLWSFGKARTRAPNQEEKVTFEDVAGVDEAKEELKEIIDFLSDPKKYQRLGGKIPKGVLLVGPPGTGKTLLAKAVAGEAGVPFFSISGSDFVEMFVGVGAARVRDLFDQAKRAAAATNKGCIIFIDEIDAVGGKRVAVFQGGHEERQQTLNQLLVEMDGFDNWRGIIVMAATNRPDVLDHALLRPGRFDRRIAIDLPDMLGREAILKVHARNVKLAKDIDLKRIAQQTPGFSGADLANLINEAALLAARREKQHVEMEELEEAIERVMTGPQRKSRVISKKEKKIVAYHEAGHALMSLLLPDVDPLHKVSIVPRGIAALGYTLQRPSEDRYIMKRSELLSRIKVLLGGRTAEELIFNEITTGAHNDLEVATKLARRIVAEFGMSKKLGPIVWDAHNGISGVEMGLEFGKPYSDATAEHIDEEVMAVIGDAIKDTQKILTSNKEMLIKLAEELLKKETMSVEEVRQLLGIPEPKQEADEQEDPSNGQAKEAD